MRDVEMFSHEIFSANEMKVMERFCDLVRNLGLHDDVFCKTQFWELVPGVGE